MMTVVLITVVLIALVMLVMAVGYIVKGKCLRGTCGGETVAGPDGKFVCGACGRSREPGPVTLTQITEPSQSSRQGHL